MLRINNGKIVINKEESLKILFVCTGNTCRTPMCEAIFNRDYGSENVIASSAGLSADGSAVSENAVLALAEIGIEIDKSRKSRNVTEEEIKSADAVICVSKSHAYALSVRFLDYKDKIMYMPADITDPFGGGIDVYRACRDDISAVFRLIFEKED